MVVAGWSLWEISAHPVTNTCHVTQPTRHQHVLTRVPDYAPGRCDMPSSGLPHVFGDLPPVETVPGSCYNDPVPVGVLQYDNDT